MILTFETMNAFGWLADIALYLTPLIGFAFSQFGRGPLRDEGDGDGGGDGSGTPDDVPEPMRKFVTDTVNGAINGFAKRFTEKDLPKQLKGMQNGLLAALRPPEEPADDPNDPLADPPKDPPADKSLDPKIVGELKRLRAAQKASEEKIAEQIRLREESEKKAESAERQSAVSRMLSAFDFNDDSAAGVAQEYILARVERSEEGDLVAGGLPLTQFVDDTMGGAMRGLLRGRGSGGSGVRNGADGGGKKQNGVVDTDTIKPGWSKEDRDKTWSAIRAAWQSR